ncbi:transcription factor MYC2 [Sorghum bicolor]|uniref:Uncharacterized protein n=2 Tax=Sorghum bicolor TaxID=4558 RepID=A0A109ND18_SORBI|nr:transcription factor MYC2 [Sorghum bicolor]OQU77368.1 hypothetical protein SORBI_3009G036333 [Sorghum bicolor]|eukprot:XP_021306359.1 transcription factor MYC2 [Sorghum bicolor]
MEAEAASNMEDSSLFMQWAMDTLLQEEEPAVDDVHWAMDTLLQEEEEEHAAVDGGDAVVFPSLQALRDASHAAEMVRELMAVAAAAETHDAAAANSSPSGGSGDGGGEVTDGGSSGATGTDPAAPATTAATDYYGGSWPPQSPTSSSFARAPPPAPPSSNSNTILPTVSWNFVTGSAQPGSEGVLEEAAVPARSLPPPELAQRRRSPPPPRRAAHHPVRSMGAPSSASCTPDHIVAERKRREKINKRLIELSTVIPGLKKMDKATILSDAAKYVKELQQRLKALEDAAAADAGSIRRKAPPAADENGGSGSPTSASSSSGAPALPEIEARLSERSVMVRIHSCGGKGVAAAALAVVEGLGLTVVHANVMPFSACTISITITAEASPFSSYYSFLPIFILFGYLD